MCGIYLTNIPFEKEEIAEKLNSIKYRGPDNMGITKVNSTSLGHLRLAILDLDVRSNQPFIYKNLHIVFNGEIYNYLDIKKELGDLGYSFKTLSDTEVLLIGYKHWGKDVLEKLNGMFAFCIYDSEINEVFCARDRLGVKPFYYYWNNGELEICSQLRPLIKNRKINEAAISMYLDCDYVPSPYSIIQNVYKLPPGSYMTINLSSKRQIIEKYWDIKKEKVSNISYDEAKEQLHILLADAVKIRLQSDVPLGSFLSGGIDSALVSSIATEVSDTTINTFSIGFDDPKYDESKVARKFADIIGTNHKEIICSPNDIMKLIPKLIEVYDEPFADSSALPSLLLNKVAKKYVTVALSGDGGDESFLGYNHFSVIYKLNKFFYIPYWIRKILSKTFIVKLIAKILKIPLESINNIFKAKTILDLIPYIFLGFNSLQKKRNFSWLNNYKDYKITADNFIQNTADFNIKLWLENDSNVKVDRASMAYSVEVRSPFLDYRIIEFARRLPVSFRTDKGKNNKKILRDVLKDYIPEEVFDLPKKGFGVPIREWMKKELREEFETELNDDFLNKVPNLNVEKFKMQFEKHMKGEADYNTNIWKLFVLAKWYKEFGF